MGCGNICLVSHSASRWTLSIVASTALAAGAARCGGSVESKPPPPKSDRVAFHRVDGVSDAADVSVSPGKDGACWRSTSGGVKCWATSDEENQRLVPFSGPVTQPFGAWICRSGNGNVECGGLFGFQVFPLPCNVASFGGSPTLASFIETDDLKVFMWFPDPLFCSSACGPHTQEVPELFGTNTMILTTGGPHELAVGLRYLHNGTVFDGTVGKCSNPTFQAAPVPGLPTGIVDLSADETVARSKEGSIYLETKGPENGNLCATEETWSVVPMPFASAMWPSLYTREEPVDPRPVLTIKRQFTGCATEPSGAVWCWGNGAPNTRTEACTCTCTTDQVARAPELDGAIYVSTDDGFGCAVLADHTLWCWGGI